MITIRSFFVIFLLSALTNPILPQDDNISFEQNTLHAQKWANTLTQSLDAKNIQLAANIIYLLYANAVVDVKIRQFVIPITRLTQTVRLNITNYKNTSKELITLKTLLDRLSHIIGARTIYNQILKVCLDYYATHQTMALTQSILQLQTYGQKNLNEYAEAHYSKISEQLLSSCEILAAGVQPLQDISKLHGEIASGALLASFKNNDKTKEFAALITLDELLKNNSTATQNAEHILNTLDLSTEEALQLISSATDIYKQHYEALYTYISSDTFDQSYAYTLFGMNDLLPKEYATLLPHPDNVFEHVLQTIKLYTQIELIQ